MVEKLKRLLGRFIEFWNRYTSKQKTIIICTIAAVIFAIAVMVAVFSRTQYTQLEVFETTADAAEAKRLLEENSIEVLVSGTDATVLSVDKKRVSDAKLLLGENGISAAASEDNSWLWDNSMSTTDSDRKVKNRIAAQQEIENVLKDITGVKTADVTVYIPDTSSAIYKDDKQATVSIMLAITDEFTRDASTIASYAANTMGTTVDNVRILNQDGELLYSGADNAASGKDKLSIKEQVENSYCKQLRNVLISSGAYNDVEVAMQLDVNLNEDKITDTKYYSNDDDTDNTGPVTNSYTYEAENVEGIEGVVGTDANGEDITDTDLLTGGAGNSTVAVVRKEHATSSTVTERSTQVGTVNTDNSSVAIVLSHYVIYNEEDMEAQGLLKDTSYEEFKAAHADSVLTTVDDNILTLASKATGIAEKNISILAYDVPIFYDKPESEWSFERILQLVLAAFIVGFILFVVIKGMKPVEVVELEPELSVEALLATTKENQTLDDIEFSEKSATRTQIEKFVDENPEAVAALLRNWLNDDWS